MKSFEDSPQSFIADLQTEYYNSNLTELKNLEKFKLELAHEQEYLQLQSDDLDKKIKKFVSQKENFEQQYRKKQEALRKKELDLGKKEAEIYKLYEQYSNEKEKWKRMLDIQLEELENKELDLEVQREELATELEKCQLLGENLHKIQSDIRNKSLMVNEKERQLKGAEENMFMKSEDLMGFEVILKEKEQDVFNKEKELFEVIQILEFRGNDIEKASEMLESINRNLMIKENKVRKDTEALIKAQKSLDKQMVVFKQRAKELEVWENELKVKEMTIVGKENNEYQKIKLIESIDFKNGVPSVTTEEDDECCVIGFNVLTPRSNESSG